MNAFVHTIYYMHFILPCQVFLQKFFRYSFVNDITAGLQLMNVNIKKWLYFMQISDIMNTSHKFYIAILTY